MNKPLNSFLNLKKIDIVLEIHNKEDCFLVICINDELICKLKKPELFGSTPNDRDLSAYEYLVENNYLPYRDPLYPLYLEGYCRDHDVKFSSISKTYIKGFKHQR
jgi:hypothetical protein